MTALSGTTAVSAAASGASAGVAGAGVITTTDSAGSTYTTTTGAALATGSSNGTSSGGAGNGTSGTGLSGSGTNSTSGGNSTSGVLGGGTTTTSGSGSSTTSGVSLRLCLPTCNHLKLIIISRNPQRAAAPPAAHPAPVQAAQLQALVHPPAPLLHPAQPANRKPAISQLGALLVWPVLPPTCCCKLFWLSIQKVPPVSMRFTDLEKLNPAYGILSLASCIPSIPLLDHFLHSPSTYPSCPHTRAFIKYPFG